MNSSNEGTDGGTAEIYYEVYKKYWVNQTVNAIDQNK
jgi:hypothetical protein